MKAMADPKRAIAFQGDYGAFSHMACKEAAPDYEPLPCNTFEDTFAAVTEGRAARAMIPVENSVAGRVADIHRLLPESDLHIIGEHFQPVHLQLMAVSAATLETVREAHSHIHALPQCRRALQELNLKPVVHADTAGACRMVAERGDPAIAAIGSRLAAEIYGLQILREDIEDHSSNVTRFLVMTPERIVPHRKEGPVITTFVFQVRSVPAALYKAMGGFATNGVNLTKLESYMKGGVFEQVEFYVDIEGHPDDEPVRRAFEELRFFSTRLKLLGTYPKHPSSIASKARPR
jgi:prephenate dehydratase